MTDQEQQAAETLWRYHQIDRAPEKSDVGIGLGSHDLGVADVAVRLFKDGLFPILLFTGATSPTTRERFPRGEAVHYSEYAVNNGVPPQDILVEPEAANTSENFTKSHELLTKHGIEASSILVICKPYMQRRALLTCGKVWPEVKISCASEDISLDQYIQQMGDPKLVFDMLVGDTQRVEVYGKKGFTLEESLPPNVQDAYRFLVERGYTSRLLS